MVLSSKFLDLALVKIIVGSEIASFSGVSGEPWNKGSEGVCGEQSVGGISTYLCLQAEDKRSV